MEGREQWKVDSGPEIESADRNNWRSKFAVPLVTGLAITLAVAFGVYLLVRAIGWVIGGFAAS